jgi:alpha-L-fucosidase
MGFKRLRDEAFRSSLLHQQGTKVNAGGGQLSDGNSRSFVTLGKDGFIDITFAQPTAINCILLQEPIQLGQRVKAFSIQVTNEDGSLFETEGTTIGHKRIITFPTRHARSVKIMVKDSKAVPLISELGIYHIPENLVERP